jgi:RNA polymerase sigma-70 factor (ECF subfamily)
MCAADGDVTILLRAMKDGDESAGERLLPLVYGELHKLAKSYMRRERPDHTLQPTALINEAYLRLAGDALDFQSRQHFIGVAATIMRRVLVDHARAHNAGIRGGSLQRVELEENVAISQESSDEILALHDTLSNLEKVNARQAKIVELRYFAGLSVEEISVLLNLSPRSVKRDWALARLWLFKEIQTPGIHDRSEKEDP